MRIQLFLALMVLAAACGSNNDTPAITPTGQQIDTANLQLINPGDNRFSNAVDSAQAGLPHFVEAFANNSSDQHFFVKVALADDQSNVEHVWTRVVANANGRFTALLDAPPANARMYHTGDTLEVPHPDVEDWIIGDENGILEGNFMNRNMNQ